MSVTNALVYKRIVYGRSIFNAIQMKNIGRIYGIHVSNETPLIVLTYGNIWYYC